MAICPSYTIDSNITGLYITEERCLGELPTSPDPIWQGFDPNSYSDFGGELETVTREPIDPSRQDKKGSVVGMTANGGFSIDIVRENLPWLLQGFFWADARQHRSTRPMSGANAVLLTSVVAADNEYQAASGLSGIFPAGTLVRATGFANPVNNGLKTVVATTATAVEVAEVLVNEATAPAISKLDEVGVQFASQDVAISVDSGIVSLTSTVYSFTGNTKLFVGMWVHIGGDNAATRFVNNRGFARISAISANSLTFDQVSWSSPVTEAAPADSTIQMFVPLTVKNETASLVKRRSYQIERTLGKGSSGNTQAQYLVGSVANELTVNCPAKDKLTVDMAYVATNEDFRSGGSGDTQKLGTRVPVVSGDAINTSNDVFQLRLYTHATVSNPTPLFSYVTEGSWGINNGVTPQDAVGILGALDLSSGNFKVTGSVTAYFVNVEASRAIRANANVGFNAIFSRDNYGHIWDIPLVTLSGGQVTVEKDSPITIPLEMAGAENANGYTMSFTYFSYLPNVAMAINKGTTPP